MTTDFDVATAGTFIDAEIASHALWHHGLGGRQPGSFITHLIEAIVRADPANRARLGLGFPGYVGAMTLLAEHDNGVAVLRDICESGR